MIDIDTNPLYYAAAGGAILGIATSINYCVRGKVTGMSGIVDSISSFKTCIDPLLQNSSPKNFQYSEVCSSSQLSSLTSLNTEPLIT